MTIQAIYIMTNWARPRSIISNQMKSYWPTVQFSIKNVSTERWRQRRAVCLVKDVTWGTTSKPRLRRPRPRLITRRKLRNLCIHENRAPYLLIWHDESSKSQSWSTVITLVLLQHFSLATIWHLPAPPVKCNEEFSMQYALLSIGRRAHAEKQKTNGGG